MKVMFTRPRRVSRQVKVGKVPVGGNAPISVQSMTTTDTRDIDATVAQIKRLEDVGCDIVRVAVLNKDAAEVIGEIKRQIDIPLVADIHFHYRLALRSIEQGVDKMRINPGNIGSDDRVERVVAACKERGVPIRIGVNTGSLEKDLVKQYGRYHPQALVDSALRKVRLLEKHGFADIVISLKSSEVPSMVEAYRLMAKSCEYPLHLGVTEAGPLLGGTIKSALAFGLLLHEGIGDTMRVSLSADPVEEIKVGHKILQALGFKVNIPELVSCPTCGRLQTDLFGLIERVEKALEGIRKPIRVSVMGCNVNGPGEAAGSHLAVIGGKDFLTLARNGKVVAKLPPEELEERLLTELESLK
jgi:(E)-4-hydroxy-3-methylbut-2-enyl-diphosphate synthase